MDHARLTAIAERLKLPNFRIKQLAEAFFEQRVEDYESITTLSRDLRAKLTEDGPVLSVRATRIQVSADGRAHKALVALSDGREVETVLLNPKPGLWSTCISSQVGCALACTFCATGQLGFTRNLTSEEITDQVLFWWQYIKREGLDANLRNVVFMGMGEPFMNRRHVFAALEELSNPATFNIGSRHLSVSTVGVVRAIRELAERFPQVNLAISLHAPNDELRLKMMPINRGIPLATLAEALRDYLGATNRKVFMEYILLRGENDREQHARELVTWLKALGSPSQIHVNLIVYNPTDAPHEATAREDARRFCSFLQDSGVSTTIRRNLGQDIDGACGQLALKGRPPDAASIAAAVAEAVNGGE